MDKIKKLYELDKELQELLRKESDKYGEAQINKKDKLDLKEKGQETDITEEEAWEEIRIIGPISRCFETMREKYPKLFGRLIFFTYLCIVVNH